MLAQQGSGDGGGQQRVGATASTIMTNALNARLAAMQVARLQRASKNVSS
jgi:hypothetical protein